MKQTAYLLLGGDLGDCPETFRAARQEIHRRVGRITRASELFNSPAWGFESENLFYNQALEVSTELDPYALLRTVLEIETQLGRVRPIHPETVGSTDGKKDGSPIGASTGEGRLYASRMIDIDILFYGQTVIRSPELTVPHPLLQERAFALIPLERVAPDLVHPLLDRTVAQLLRECPDTAARIKPCDLPAELVFSDTSADPVSPCPYRTGGSGAMGTAGGMNAAVKFPEGIRFIAIEGNIGAGKTSLARRIARQFGAKLVVESFEENIFLPKFYENKDRYAFPLELTFLAERYRQAKEDFVQELFSPFIVSDFSISKSLIFAQNTLQEDEYSLFARLYHIILTSVPKPDLYVYIHSDTDRLMRNIRQRGRSYETNMDPLYLQRIEKGYLDYIRTLKPERSVVIPVGDMDFVHHEADYACILEKIIRAAHRAVASI